MSKNIFLPYLITVLFLTANNAFAESLTNQDLRVVFEQVHQSNDLNGATLILMKVRNITNMPVVFYWNSNALLGLLFTPVTGAGIVPRDNTREERAALGSMTLQTILIKPDEEKTNYLNLDKFFKITGSGQFEFKYLAELLYEIDMSSPAPKLKTVLPSSSGTRIKRHKTDGVVIITKP